MADIDYYKRKVKSLKNEKAQYQELRNDLNDSLNPKLKNIIEDLDVAIKKNNIGYVVDEITADGKAIIKNRELINGYKNEIYNKVIPAIDDKIRNINSNINYYNNLIKKAEEEAAAAAEAEAEEEDDIE